MKLVLNNVTYHDCPIDAREKIAFTAEQRRLMLKRMHTEQFISEAVILETCNRLEFYVYAKKDFDVRGFLAELIGQVSPPALDTWLSCSGETTGTDVVRHLFEVAAGLESQMIGENQILRQVKSAYAESLDCRMSKFMFHHLFHNAFRAGKAVRNNTNINCGAVSIGLAAVELAREKLNLPSSTAMVIGAGENAELVAQYLVKSGLPRLIIANRNLQKAKAMAERLKANDVIGLEDLAKKLLDVDLVISSTASARPIVTYEAVQQFLAARDKSLLMIDIAVPRDIDPNISSFPCVALFNIDDLNAQVSRNRHERQNEVPKAEKLVAEFTDKFSQWYESLNVIPVISRLTEKNIQLAHNEARRYANQFGETNSTKLERFAESLVKKVLHGPITFLKNGEDKEPSTEQLEAADLVNKMFLSEGKRDR